MQKIINSYFFLKGQNLQTDQSIFIYETEKAKLSNRTSQKLTGC
jgi:hypothetical protein